MYIQAYRIRQLADAGIAVAEANIVQVYIRLTVVKRKIFQQGNQVHSGYIVTPFGAFAFWRLPAD